MPIVAAWHHANQPEPPDTPPPTTHGQCLITGVTGPGWPTKTFIGGNTPLDRIARHRGAGMISEPAGWAMKTWGPIRGAHCRWRDPDILGTVITPTATTDLRRGDPPPDTTGVYAVIVPSTKQGHPWVCDWGQWSTESGVVTPTVGMLDAVPAVYDLRARGLNEKEIDEVLPQPHTIERLGYGFGEAVKVWEAVATTQQAPAFHRALTLLTRQPKDTK